MPKEVAYQNIHDELQLDGIPKLNLASFVTTDMEEECNKLIMESINKNYVDMDEYPITTELHVRLPTSLLSLISHNYHYTYIFSYCAREGTFGISPNYTNLFLFFFP